MAFVSVRKDRNNNAFQVVVKIPFSDKGAAKQVAEEIANGTLEVK